jgi:hypothetical protein
MRPWYDYLHTLLQMFRWQDGSAAKTWVLKTPEHMGNLDLFFDRFPDARVVCTHRDPVVATTSMAVLTIAARRMYRPPRRARHRPAHPRALGGRPALCVRGGSGGPA